MGSLTKYLSQKQMLFTDIHYMNCSIGSGLTVANPLLGMVALSVATSVSVYKSLVSRSNEMLTERLPYRVVIDRRELRHNGIILPSKKRLCSQNQAAGSENETRSNAVCKCITCLCTHHCINVKLL